MLMNIRKNVVVEVTLLTCHDNQARAMKFELKDHEVVNKLPDL